MKNLNSMSKNCFNLYGGSVKGPKRKFWSLNQDFYLIKNKPNFSIALVADGVGSLPKSRKVAHFVVKEIYKIIFNFLKKNKYSSDGLFEKIYSTFPFKKITKYKGDCTLLFALKLHNKICLFQIGDGLVHLIINKTKQYTFCSNKEFSNVTRSFLKSNISYAQYKEVHIDISDTINFILCTDGVSEDLEEKTLSEFVMEFTNQLTGKTNQNKTIINLLKNWPNIYASDDKTIIGGILK